MTGVRGRGSALQRRDSRSRGRRAARDDGPEGRRLLAAGLARSEARLPAMELVGVGALKMSKRQRTLVQGSTGRRRGIERKENEVEGGAGRSKREEGDRARPLARYMCMGVGGGG